MVHTLNILKKPCKSVANDCETVVNSCENVVKPAKNLEKEVVKLKIPNTYRWKSSRNLLQNSFTYRPSVRKIANIIGVGSFLACLALTYIKTPTKIQVMCYASSVSLLLLTDTLHAFSRVLAAPSRYMLSSIFAMLVIGLSTDDYGVRCTFIIVSLVFLIIIRFLNNLWLKSESIKFSKEAEHAMQLDADNLATQSWQAEGKKNSRWILYSLGYVVDEDDLETFIKSIYLLGYINNFKQQQKLKREFTKEKRSLEKDYNSLAEEYDQCVDDYNELLRNYKELEYALNRKRAEEKEKEYVVLVPPEDEEESDVDQQEEANPIVPPKDVTDEQLKKVLELLSKDESDNHIEKVTGVSRYKVGLIKKQLN